MNCETRVTYIPLLTGSAAALAVLRLLRVPVRRRWGLDAAFPATGYRFVEELP